MYLFRTLFILVLHLLPALAGAQCVEGDCVNGKGKMVCDCGYVFEGEFRNGEKYYGTLTKNDLVYTGYFKDDMAHGKGSIVYKDSSRYEGGFAYNKANGTGTFYFPDGWEYHGSFRDDEFYGAGVLHAPGDTVFRMGCFVADRLNGPGVFTDERGSVVFGWFENGALTSFGIEKKDDDFLFSTFKNGRRKKTEVFRAGQNRVVQMTVGAGKEQFDITVSVKVEDGNAVWIIKRAGESDQPCDWNAVRFDFDTDRPVLILSGVSGEWLLYSGGRIVKNVRP